jgi:predicted nucleic acid-binding protein
MILADTSVWIDHLRSGDKTMAALLDEARILTHPFVIGELALGNLRRREVVLSLLHDLASSTIASDAEVLVFVESNALAGRGIGLIDVHLLASTRLNTGATLWTRDKRLREIAEEMGVATRLP